MQTSLPQGNYRGGIKGPRAVIKAEVIDSREWTEVISSDGVKTYVSQLRKRALVDLRARRARCKSTFPGIEVPKSANKRFWPPV